MSIWNLNYKPIPKHQYSIKFVTSSTTSIFSS